MTRFHKLPFGELVPGSPLLIAFAGAPGDQACSAVAINAAVYLAAVAAALATRRFARGDQQIRVPRILLLDAAGQGGGHARRVGAPTTPSLQTLCEHLRSRLAAGLDGEGDLGAFVRWPAALPNLHMLACPQDPGYLATLDAELCRALSWALARSYDVILIDLGEDLELPANRRWLAEATLCCLLSAGAPELVSAPAPALAALDGLADPDRGYLDVVPGAGADDGGPSFRVLRDDPYADWVYALLAQAFRRYANGPRATGCAARA